MGSILDGEKLYLFFFHALLTVTRTEGKTKNSFMSLANLSDRCCVSTLNMLGHSLVNRKKLVKACIVVQLE